MDPLTKPEWRAGVRRVLADDIGIMVGTGGPSGISAPVGSTWRQTDANASHGNLAGLLWNKVGSGTTEGTDWLVDFEGRWITYTPTLTATTTNPTNWTQDGRYTLTGKLATAKFKVTAGASMTRGSGYYRIALPATGNASPDNVRVATPILAWDNDASALRWCSGYIAASDSGRLYIDYQTSFTALGLVSDTTPWTWAANDYLLGQFTYEIA